VPSGHSRNVAVFNDLRIARRCPAEGWRPVVGRECPESDTEGQGVRRHRCDVRFDHPRPASLRMPRARVSHRRPSSKSRRLGRIVGAIASSRRVTPIVRAAVPCTSPRGSPLPILSVLGGVTPPVIGGFATLDTPLSGTSVRRAEALRRRGSCATRRPKTMSRARRSGRARSGSRTGDPARPGRACGAALA
jgi:hypothetical protein